MNAVLSVDGPSATLDLGAHDDAESVGLFSAPTEEAVELDGAEVKEILGATRTSERLAVRALAMFEEKRDLVSAARIHSLLESPSRECWACAHPVQRPRLRIGANSRKESRPAAGAHRSSTDADEGASPKDAKRLDGDERSGLQLHGSHGGAPAPHSASRSSRRRARRGPPVRRGQCHRRGRTRGTRPSPSGIEVLYVTHPPSTGRMVRPPARRGQFAVSVTMTGNSAGRVHRGPVAGRGPRRTRA